MAKENPSTWTDFVREMRTICNPYANVLTKFERACEAMWYEGELQALRLAAITGASRPTCIRWINAAKVLGLQKGQRRLRSAIQETEARRTVEKAVKMTTEERRDRYISMLDTLLDQNAENPDQVVKLIAQQTSIVPGLKAPETRLDVQLIIGKESDAALEARLTENLQWLVKNDRSFLGTVFERAGIKPGEILQAFPDAEVVDEEPADLPGPASPGRRLGTESDK